MNDLGDLATPAAAAGLVAGLLGFLRWLLGRRGDLVTELRKALDRGLVRESAAVVACEHLVFAIDMIPDPPPSVLELRARALAVLEDARSRMNARGDK